MCLICHINRFITKRIQKWRKLVFRHAIKCPHKKFQLLGEVHLVNPNVTLGKDCIIYPGVCFYGNGPIVIGDNTAIGNNVVIFASKQAGVYIGNDCAIAAHCYIIDADHGIARGAGPIRKQPFKSAEIKIGNDVWIGAGVKVLKGVHIADGCVVGAQAVVVSSLQEDSIAVGIPARSVKTRLP